MCHELAMIILDQLVNVNMNAPRDKIQHHRPVVSVKRLSLGTFSAMEHREVTSLRELWCSDGSLGHPSTVPQSQILFYSIHDPSQLS